MAQADARPLGAAYDDALARLTAVMPGAPFVVAQLGQSLDGRIATETGDSRWINGDGALDHLHRLRAAVDAVVVGAGTVRADDPQLNVRRCDGRNPARVVIDPSDRLPDTGRWLTDDGARRIVIVAEGRAPRDQAGATASQVGGVERLVLPADADGQIAPRSIIAALADAGLRRVLIEGGARTISQFIDADMVDRLHLLVGSVIIGSGIPGLAMAPVARLADARRPQTHVITFADGDVLFDCDLRTRSGDSTPR